MRVRDFEKIPVSFYMYRVLVSRSRLLHPLGRSSCAYKGMQDGYQARTDLAIDPEMLKKVEQMVKDFKVHRCAMDFDGRFCKRVLNDSNDNGAWKMAHLYMSSFAAVASVPSPRLESDTFFSQNAS